MLQIHTHMPQLRLQKVEALRQARPRSTLGLLQIIRLSHMQTKMEYGSRSLNMLPMSEPAEPPAEWL